jgi:hypothetical protein
MELLDLENSLEEIKSLDLANYLVLPINANLDNFKAKILKLKFPLWIKLNSWEHKLKLGAIKKINSFEDLVKTHSQLQKQFPGKKFILQEDVSGIEIIAGIKTDKTFDKVLLIGAGGTLAEIMQDTESRILPVEKEEIESAIKELKIYKILEEKQANISSLVGLIKKFSDLKIEEADLNPIIVNEKEAVVVDARISLEE